MNDWDIDVPFDTEPAHVPTGDECWRRHGARACGYWKLGRNCGKTDCAECGRKAAAELRAFARLGAGGIVPLAREVNRIANAYGARIPDGAVSRGDLARVYAARNGNRWDALDMPAYAWADAVCEDLSGPVRFSHVYDSEAENLAQAAGVQFVESWQAEQRRLRAAVQAMADADITSAAGALPSDAPAGPQSDVRRQPSCGPGFESRAQHRR